MDFHTLEISFHPEGLDFITGRITHFAQFVEERTTYSFTQEEEFLGIFINLGENQRYLCGKETHVFLNHQYNLMHLTRHAYTFVLERGYHSWICLHYNYKELLRFSGCVPLLEEFLRHMNDGPAIALWPVPMPAPYEMLDIIHGMMRDRLVGVSRDYYLHMKSAGVLLASLMHTLKHPKVHLSARDQKQLNELGNYLADNFKFNHTTADLADKVGMSEYHLKQRFHSLFGMSVPCYIIDLKMKKAKELLKGTTLPIKNIAGIVGYMSSSTFVHAFHREVGISPGGFRLGHRKR